MKELTGSSVLKQYFFYSSASIHLFFIFRSRGKVICYTVFMNKSTQEILTGLQTLHLPRWEELPDFNLYMDQVLSLLNGWLEPLNFEKNKGILTSGMINNYVKNSIVKAPVKKHYKKYHLAYLLVVACMKRCYSLSEIAGLIRIYSDIEDPTRIAKDYNRVIQILEGSIQEILDSGTCRREYFDEPDQTQLLVTSVMRSVACKIYAEIQLISAEEQNAAGKD